MAMNRIKLAVVFIILVISVFSVSALFGQTATDGIASDKDVRIQHTEQGGGMWSCPCGAESGRQFYRGRRGELVFSGGQCKLGMH
jgi:hypothetical protein